MSDIPEYTPPPEVPPTPPSIVAEANATETGLPQNIAAALAEFFSLVGGIVFYFIEKKNPFIRFHALQAAYLGAFAAAFGFVIPIVFTVLLHIPLIGWLISVILAVLMPLFGFAFTVVWIIAIVKALQGKEWEIPWIGKLARKHLAEGLFFYVKSPAV